MTESIFAEFKIKTQNGVKALISVLDSPASNIKSDSCGKLLSAKEAKDFLSAKACKNGATE